MDTNVFYISKEKAEPICANDDPARYNYDINNYFKLQIGNSADAIIDLISLETLESVRTLYIPKSTEYMTRNIPEGKYFVKVIYGEGYQETTTNGVCKLSFQNERMIEKGEDELDFNTVKNHQGLNVPSYSMTLDIADEYDTD